MKIKQFLYSADNFGYLVYGQGRALAIDGGAVKEIISFIDSKKLKLEAVAGTHEHADHTVGRKDLLKATNAVFLDNRTLLKKNGFEFAGGFIKTFHTPGHTADSITFSFDNILVTGDTLFNGTVGNCFSGDLEGFYNSIKTLMGFPGDMIIYAGHDYIKESMEFAKFVEPDNTDIDIFLKNYDPGHVRSTLEEEKKINPYLRFNQESVISFLEQRGLPVETEYERWDSLMSID